ncbi:MAG TPA: hypothetical protein VN031_02280 [Candidatus Microsaccharimonas sp.]|nr:hypothetical protein [Candidatus Microsaccharimonas sp.]
MTRNKWMIGALVCALLVVAAFIVAAVGDGSKSSAPAATDTPSAIKPTDGSKQQVNKHVVKVALEQQGFKPSQIQFDPSKKTTVPAGSDIFSKEVRDPATMVKFLNGGSPQAQTIIKQAMNQTGATRAQVLDSSNYVLAQLNAMTDWTGNTYFQNGQMQSASNTKTDAAGTQVLVFVPPDQVAAGKVTSLAVWRVACTNPQSKLPKPHPTCKQTGACSPNCHTTGTCTPSNCHQTGTCTPPHHKCPCITPTQAQQPVPTPPPGPAGAPSQAPHQNPTVPANTASPAPPTPGGYNGGSTQQPGQSGSPTPVVPSSDPTNTGDPGGF